MDGAVSFRLGGHAAHPVTAERLPAGWGDAVEGRCHAVESPHLEYRR